MQNHCWKRERNGDYVWERERNGRRRLRYFFLCRDGDHPLFYVLLDSERTSGVVVGLLLPSCHVGCVWRAGESTLETGVFSL
jgi:hypothetical protein